MESRRKQIEAARAHLAYAYCLAMKYGLGDDWHKISEAQRSLDRLLA